MLIAALITIFLLIASALVLCLTCKDGSAVITVQFSDDSNDIEFRLRKACKTARKFGGNSRIIAVYCGDDAENSIPYRICKIFQRDHEYIKCISQNEFEAL